MNETLPIELYWQPGCTSCLRTKEFLARHAIAYRSINVQEEPAAYDRLARLGARTVPVVARGERFVFGQDVRDVAAFLSITLDHRALPPEELVRRLDRVLAVAIAGTRQLPDAALQTLLPRRKRTYRELAWHIFRIPAAFLEAVQDGKLSDESPNRKPPPEVTTTAALVAAGEAVRRDLGTWAASADPSSTMEIDTYFGRKALPIVLERTTWHSAQHTRQLAMVLSLLGLEPAQTLGPDDLKGLPLPEQVWDAVEA